MRYYLAVGCVALSSLLLGCGGGDDDSAGESPTATATVAASATSTSTPLSTQTATPVATATFTPTPTVTAIATATATATVTASSTPTDTPNPALCAGTAASILSEYVGSLNAAQRRCYEETGERCARDDSEVESAAEQLEDDVLAACPDAATVQAAGYGSLFTPATLNERLRQAGWAEAASLAARSFGGPHGAVLSATDAAGRQCLVAAHAAASSLVHSAILAQSDCVRAGDECDTESTNELLVALETQLLTAIESDCDSLPALIAVDAETYASRALAQSRCLTAIAHPDPSPLELDCGPREEIVEAARGEYVQVVLDEAVWGTRCGDGSPFAFWIRLAPEGQPVENVVVGMQGGGVCVFAEDCATRPADLFEAMNDQPPTTGTMSNDPEISPFANWTKVYLPYCNQDVFIGGGATSNFSETNTVHRFGAVNVRAAMRYLRDLVWRELDATTEEGYRADRMRVLFGGFSAGAFGTLYNYHYLLDDLQWVHTAAYPDAGLALDSGGSLSIAALGILLISDTPPLGWGSRNYLPPYCFATNCGVGPILLEATSPRLKEVPEQQFLILSNQVDLTQVGTTFFADLPAWINELRRSYCETRNLLGVQYYLPAITQNVHVISPRNDLYTDRPVDGVLMRDWLAGGFSAPDEITDRVEEGTLVDDYPGTMPFDCLGE